LLRKVGILTEPRTLPKGMMGQLLVVVLWTGIRKLLAHVLDMLQTVCVEDRSKERSLAI